MTNWLIMPKSLIVVAVIGVVVVVAAASFILLHTPVQKRAQLIVNNFSLWDQSAGKNLLWASVSMKDSAGNLVAGLSLKDFNLSETLLDSKENVIQELSITFIDYAFGEANSYYQFYGDGFWERSVTSEKLDIVFLVDMTGSMEGEMSGIHSELHEFVNRLLSEHVDFRISIVKYEGSTVENSPAESYTDWAFTMPFRGVMEAEEIHQWLDHVQLSGGEWWDPAASYDQLMLVVRNLILEKMHEKLL
ncbi:MAG: VWA domain-containing protein [Candidatus Brockarchaeota archaeon]|nr:VWA domain-containing protein [Candidatus Brockarchaeota archaeon]